MALPKITTWGVQDLQHALDAGASDYVMPDVMKIGPREGHSYVESSLA